jgi:hypothetical protein
MLKTGRNALWQGYDSSHYRSPAIKRLSCFSTKKTACTFKVFTGMHLLAAADL